MVLGASVIRMHLDFKNTCTMLFISLISLFFLFGITDSNNTNLKEFEVLGNVADTLFCLGFDDYLYTAFNIKNTIDQGWQDNNEIVTLPFSHLECYEHLWAGYDECLKNYNIFEDDSNIVVFSKYVEEKDESNYSLRFALIQSSYVELNRKIHIGMQKDELCEIINLKQNIDNINVIVFISSRNNYMGYFFFKESRLSCILIELDDGNDKHFLSRLKNYPNYIINHINKDAEYVFQGLTHFLIFPDE